MLHVCVAQHQSGVCAVAECSSAVTTHCCIVLHRMLFSSSQWQPCKHPRIRVHVCHDAPSLASFPTALLLPPVHRTSDPDTRTYTSLYIVTSHTHTHTAYHTSHTPIMAALWEDFDPLSDKPKPARQPSQPQQQHVNPFAGQQMQQQPQQGHDPFR